MTGTVATSSSIDGRADDGVLRVSLDDGKVNALSEPVVEHLLAALQRSADERLPFVLAGRSGVLSAGLDLKIVQGDDVDARHRLMAAAQHLYATMLHHTQPVVIACTGHALAAGAFLLLCADYRVGPLQAAKIGMTEVSIGVTMSSFVASIAEQRLSRRHLVRSTVLGEIFAPETAVDAGFLDEVAADPVGAAVNAAQGFGALDSKTVCETRARVFARLWDGRQEADG